MSSTTVHVTGISNNTSEREVKDFFSFCGKISSLSLSPSSDTQSADVVFEKPNAAKTALLLDNTQLGSSLVHVSAASGVESATSGSTAASTDEGLHHLAQEDKPRARIIAEYLAHGYTISDSVITKAIQHDQQHGYSAKFTNLLKNVDQRTGASTTAANIDQKYAVSDTVVATANTAFSSLNSYFEKAMGTPTGQRVRSFYQVGNQQVMDVHNEARRLADLKKEGKHMPEKVAGSEKTVCSCSSNEGTCGCAPGKCGCADCPKNGKSEGMPSKEEAQMETVQDGKRTKCNCGGSDGKCPCEPGKCACGSCSKNPEA